MNTFVSTNFNVPLVLNWRDCVAIDSEALDYCSKGAGFDTISGYSPLQIFIVDSPDYTFLKIKSLEF